MLLSIVSLLVNRQRFSAFTVETSCEIWIAGSNLLNEVSVFPGQTLKVNWRNCYWDRDNSRWIGGISKLKATNLQGVFQKHEKLFVHVFLLLDSKSKLRE